MRFYWQSGWSRGQVKKYGEWRRRAAPSHPAWTINVYDRWPESTVSLFLLCAFYFSVFLLFLPFVLSCWSQTPRSRMKVFVAEEKTADNQCNYSSLTVCVCVCVFRSVCECACSSPAKSLPRSWSHLADWPAENRAKRQRDFNTIYSSVTLTHVKATEKGEAQSPTMHHCITDSVC